MLLSPDHLVALRGLLEEGAARCGRSLEDFQIAPNVYACVGDDLAAARDAMRPMLALYIGGMGSREQNFYNQLMIRYGFEGPAREVQRLYLDGRQRDAAAALPDELIDSVCLCGPADRVRERLTRYRDAGVDILGITPLAPDRDGRLEQLRILAELAV